MPPSFMTIKTERIADVQDDTGLLEAAEPGHRRRDFTAR
jgi:hypothetical protein